MSESAKAPEAAKPADRLAQAVHHLAKLAEEQRKSNALLQQIRDQLAAKK